MTLHLYGCAFWVNFCELNIRLKVQKVQKQQTKMSNQHCVTKYVQTVLWSNFSTVIGTQVHLYNAQVKYRIKCMQFYNIFETFLILYRTGIFSIDSLALDLNICASHGKYLGIQWRKQISWIYQGHSEKSRSNADRGTCPTLCKLYWLKKRQILPVGAGKLTFSSHSVVGVSLQNAFYSRSD